MKKYKIKYEDYDGNIRYVEVRGYDKQNAIDHLLNCKEIYWINKQNQ